MPSPWPHPKALLGAGRDSSGGMSAWPTCLLEGFGHRGRANQCCPAAHATPRHCKSLKRSARADLAKLENALTWQLKGVLVHLHWSCPCQLCCVPFSLILTPCLLYVLRFSPFPPGAAVSLLVVAAAAAPVVTRACAGHAHRHAYIILPKPIFTLIYTNIHTRTSTPAIRMTTDRLLLQSFLVLVPPSTAKRPSHAPCGRG